MKHYNYIFTGSGLAALMTIRELILSDKIKDKTILLIDENLKKANDRTWCFWDDRNLFEDIISKKWDTALYADQNFKRNLKIKPYQYKMIQGLDFYTLVFDLISSNPNIDFVNQKVISFEDLGSNCTVVTDAETYSCDKIFNSIYNPELVRSQTKYPLLQQHFIGWFIKSEQEVFNPEVATFMDFSIEQKQNTRFMYVLPTSKTEALLEYTLFSKDVLSTKEYEDEIERYITNLGITEYEIVEKERGNIPMTCFKFWKNNTKNIVNIGSAGGWTKASTGFTFKNTTKKAKQLTAFLSDAADFRKFHKTDKFWFYDLLFIDVLYQNNAIGSKVFSSLFKKGNPVPIFKFLDDESSFLQDLQIILKCPKLPFVKALAKRIFNF
jgi:lycopene beta-cyclase